VAAKKVSFTYQTSPTVDIQGSTSGDPCEEAVIAQIHARIGECGWIFTNGQNELLPQFGIWTTKQQSPQRLPPWIFLLVEEHPWTDSPNATTTAVVHRLSGTHDAGATGPTEEGDRSEEQAISSLQLLRKQFHERRPAFLVTLRRQLRQSGHDVRFEGCELFISPIQQRISNARQGEDIASQGE
jgi:hypothetical protein